MNLIPDPAAGGAHPTPTGAAITCWICGLLISRKRGNLRAYHSLLTCLVHQFEAHVARAHPLTGQKLRTEAAKRNAAAAARAIARQQKKNADRVDGYDRDDLGESPDY